MPIRRQAMRLPVFVKCGLFVLVALTASAQAQQAPKPLSDYFPADTTLFIECPNVPHAIEQAKATGLYALWQDDSMKRIRLLVEVPAGGEESNEALEPIRNLLDVLQSISGGAALGLLPGQDGFEYLFVARLGEDTQPAKDFLDGIYSAESDEGFPPRTAEVSDVSARISGLDGEHTAIADGLLFIGSQYAVMGALDRRNAPSNAGALTSSVDFTKASSFFSGGSVAYRGYLDFPAVYEKLGAAAMGIVPFDVAGLLEISGASDIETISMEGLFSFSGVLDHIYISTSSADARILDMIGREPFDESRLSVVPREAVFFGGRTSSMEQSYDDTLKVFQMAAGVTGFDADEMIRKFEQSAGVDFERDIIGSLGDTSIGYFNITGPFSMMAFMGGTGIHQVTLMEVTDEAKIEEAIRKIVAYAQADPDVLSPLVPPTHGQAKLESTMLGDLKIYSLVHAGGQFAAPSLTVASGYLVYANSKEALIAAVDRLIAPGASVTDSPDYSRARSALAKEPVQLAYVNLDRIFDMLYEEVLPLFAPRIDSAYNEGSLPFSSADIPPAFRMKKHIDGISMAVTTSGNLIDIQLYTPCGAATMAVPAALAFFVSGEGPAATPPGLAAGQVTSAQRERLLKIGGLLQLATTERHGRFPDALAEAVPQEMLQAPQDPEPDSPVDYLYVKGLTIYTPGRTIIVHEREGLQGDGRHVLYVDGSVEFLTEDAFKAALGRTRSIQVEEEGGGDAGEEGE